MSRSAVGLRFNPASLAARYLVVVSLGNVVEAVFLTTDLPFVGLILLTPPAGFLLLRHGRFAALNGVVLAAVGPLLAYLLFALLYGVSRGDDWLLVHRYLFSFALITVIAVHVVRSSDESARRLTKLARDVLLFSAIGVILSPWLHPYLRPEASMVRFQGLWNNPNEAALMAVVLLNFVLYRPYRRLIPNGLAIAAAAAAVAVSFSRSGIFLLFISLMLFLFHRCRTLFVLIGCLVAVPLSFVLLSVLLETFEQSDLALLLNRAQVARLREMREFFSGQFYQPGSTTTYVGFRDFLWSRAIVVIGNNFPHGAGLGSFHHLEGGVAIYESISRSDWMGVHNMYLVIIGEAGVGVFVLLAVFYGRLLAKSLFGTADRLPFSIIFVILTYWMTTHAILSLGYVMVVFGIAVGVLGRTREKRFRTRGRAVSGAPDAVGRLDPARCMAGTTSAGVAVPARPPRAAARFRGAVGSGFETPACRPPARRTRGGRGR